MNINDLCLSEQLPKISSLKKIAWCISFKLALSALNWTDCWITRGLYSQFDHHSFALTKKCAANSRGCTLYAGHLPMSPNIFSKPTAYSHSWGGKTDVTEQGKQLLKEADSNISGVWVILFLLHLLNSAIVGLDRIETNTVSC